MKSSLQRRTPANSGRSASFDMDTTESSQTRYFHENNGDVDEIKNRDHPIVKSSFWTKPWVRFGIVATILAVIATVVTLLIVKPWHHPLRLAPIHNSEVKALPDEQPVWPIPKSFSFGNERVSLSPTFQIKVQAFANDHPLDTSIYPILDKAINRFKESIQLKQNTTILESNLNDNYDIPTTSSISELVIILNNAQAPLEFGMSESYVINITNFQPEFTPASNRAGLAPHDNIELYKRAPTTNIANAVIKAETQWGAIHGLSTFSQLVVAVNNPSSPNSKVTADNPLENLLEIPNVPWLIEDEPRFPHRGILLDTSRNYYPVKTIIKTLDAMALVKLNVFHWHVLDQQTYPLVSKAYPELSAKGAQRPDFIYSEKDVAYIIQHAQERGIRVIPEFDAPGHAASWGRSFPNLTVCLDAQPHDMYAAEPPAGQLDPLEPFTYKVLDTLIKEWSAQFPDKQVHIGGDEISYNCWKSSERLKDYIDHPNHRQQYEDTLPPSIEVSGPENTMRRTKAGSQTGEDRLLEVYLNRSLEMYLDQGKRPIIWEEIALEHNVLLPDSAIVQVWKNAANAKRVVEQGRPIILSSAEYWYLDCGAGQWLIGSQGKSWCDFSNWQRVYSYALTESLTEEQQKLLYGGEICMWSEQTDSSNLDSNMWPRSAAAAEVLWSGGTDSHGNNRPLIHAAHRLAVVRDKLVEMGVAAAPMYPSWCRHHPEACLAPLNK
ncbi:hypothetical protein BGZ76_005753 [Entomortierella beljakovae]|nr:hypothetical protein BGZ76_005753 [Entomortierella beljakovae]